MGNPSSENLPTGNIQALGLPVKRVEIPQEDIQEEGVQQTEPREEVAPEKATPEAPAVEPEVPEGTQEEAEELSALDQYEALVEPEPVVEDAVGLELAELRKQNERLSTQMQEMLDGKDAKLTEAAGTQDESDDIDLSSPVIQDHLRALRETDPAAAERMEARLLEEKIQQEVAKRVGGVEKSVADAEKDRKQEADKRDAEARVSEGLSSAARRGSTESELVDQWNKTPPERRQFTILGKALLNDPWAFMTMEGVYRVVRATAAEVNDRIRSGKSPATEVDESTGVSSKSRQTSVSINKKSEELSEAEQLAQENEAIAARIKAKGDFPEALNWMRGQ